MQARNSQNANFFQKRQKNLSKTCIRNFAYLYMSITNEVIID